MPGLEISDKDRRNIVAKFFCSICSLFLVQPVQTLCGHLFCSSYVENWWKKPSPKCPEDDVPLKRDEIFPDKFSSREISELTIHCRNENCEWTGQVKELEDHERDCRKFPMTCEFGNESNVSRCGRKKPEIEEWEVCPFKAVGCQHSQVTKGRLRQHYYEYLVYHLNLLLHFVWFWIKSGRINTSTPQVEGSSSRQENSPGEEGRVAIHDSSNEREARENKTDIEQLCARMDRLEGTLALNIVKLTELSIGTRGTPSYNGTLLWKIDDFNRKRQDAVIGVQTAIYSPHFYSNQLGYKMCARIHMNGDGFGKDSHISLFFVVMRGEYDALLSWPFQKKITMMLLDQTTGDHIVDSFRSDVESSAFQRPKTEKNIASGSPLFMPLDALKNRAYVKDDIMFVKIIVD